MALVYKVWVHIEEVNEEEDHWQDVGEPMEVGEFETLNEAEECANAVVDGQK